MIELTLVNTNRNKNRNEMSFVRTIIIVIFSGKVISQKIQTTDKNHEIEA
jgi:hypothetical protein